MYQTCPKCQYERQASDTSDSDTCPACGLIFSKWLKQQFSQPAEQPRAGNFQPTSSEIDESRIGATVIELKRLLFQTEAPANSLVLYARALLFLGFAIWGVYFITLDFETNAIGQSFMHVINLVFHEAGHVIFKLFGNTFLIFLGGTLGQLLMPLVVMIAFLWTNRDPFGASFGLWWLGQSFMDCAPYINDARALELILLGGGTGMDKPGMHDWNNILLDLGMLRYDHTIATWFDTVGSVIVLLAIAWGGYILLQQYRQMA